MTVRFSQEKAQVQLELKNLKNIKIAIGRIDKNKEFIKLLGLPYDKYEIKSYLFEKSELQNMIYDVGFSNIKEVKLLSKRNYTAHVAYK